MAIEKENGVILEPGDKVIYTSPLHYPTPGRPATICRWCDLAPRSSRVGGVPIRFQEQTRIVWSSFSNLRYQGLPVIGFLENHDAPENTEDDHEGMIQDYNGNWRWL